MNKEAMGNFIADVRKEKGLTQKELAEQLHVTDKAVSKWERGLSFPDISMLEPLSEIMDVTILELLEGQRIVEEDLISKEEVNNIVNQSISISDIEIRQKHKKSKTWIIIVSIVVLLLVSIVLNISNYRKAEKASQVSIDSKAYETIIMEDGKLHFVNEQDALNQLLEDLYDTNAGKEGDK